MDTAKNAGAQFQPKKIKPSAEQLAIMLGTQKTILVDANAGAAKTTTLALRMAESLARGVPPERMLALTITPAAQQVFGQRLKQIGVAATVVKKIRIETFESLSHQILQQIEQVAVPYVSGPGDLAELAAPMQDALQQVAALYGRRYALDMQSHNPALHAFWQMQYRIKATLAAFTHDFSGYTDEEIAHVLGVPLTTWLWHGQYETLRGVGEEVRFRAEGDALYDLVCLLGGQGHAGGGANGGYGGNGADGSYGSDGYAGADQSMAQAALPAYQVIMADELHDMNEAAFRLLLALLARGSAFFCGAGDKDQVIYSWRGAEPQYLQHRFAAEFPRLARYPLTTCYRHGAQLADAVARFKNKPNRAAPGVATRVRITRYPDADGLVALMAELRAYAEKGGSLGQSAVLLRSPGQSIALEAALLQNGMPYQMQDLPPFLQRPEILMLRGMMALGLQNLASVPQQKVREQLFDAMLTFAEISIEHQDQAAWLKDRDTAINQANALEWFLDGVLLRRAPYSGAAIQACRDYLRSQSMDAPAGEVLQQVCSLLRLPQVTRRVFIDPRQAAMVQESVDEFIAMAHGTGMGTQAFCTWLGQTEAQFSSSSSKGGSKDGSKGSSKEGAKEGDKSTLLLACVDDIKGKEYEAVFMPYLAQGKFPRSGVPLAEEENRFYVAITRTRAELVLLAPENHPSPFLARLG
jgi:DNA helicase-2/ATP-dependent DNA helicase PcrA